MLGILMDTSLPSVDTIVYNSRVLLTEHCDMSRNKIVQWFASTCIWVPCTTFIYSIFLFICMCIVCVCVFCYYRLLSEINLDVDDNCKFTNTALVITDKSPQAFSAPKRTLHCSTIKRKQTKRQKTVLWTVQEIFAGTCFWPLDHWDETAELLLWYNYE